MKGRSLRQEHGFALVFALMACVVLTIAATSVATYTTSSQHSSASSSSNIAASDLAEAGLNAAYSIVNKASIGYLDATANAVLIQPLPVIKNMPVGAPVPPNTSASVSPLKVVG